MGAEELVDHLKNCRGVDAVIAGDGNLDEVVNTMIAAGWTFGGVEYVEGKQCRYLVPPAGRTPEDGVPAPVAPQRKGKGIASGWADEEDYGPRYT